MFKSKEKQIKTSISPLPLPSDLNWLLFNVLLSCSYMLKHYKEVIPIFHLYVSDYILYTEIYISLLVS